ncbi:MAG: SpoIIE family protein phosphatase [Acidobacteria bacterium]|nr:SpoIIE family protein phosphatase [Acidobacteriota bacterium]
MTSLIAYAVGAWTFPGESESGDRYVVVPTKTGMLIAVIDGVGHGAEAAEAAKMAAGVVERHAAEDSIIALVKRCDEAMRATRGAVMSLASFNAEDHTVTWLSVGNVEGVLLRADSQAIPQRESVVMRGGVVGFRLPTLQAVVMPVYPGDVLIFATDGIASGFDLDISPSAPLQDIADNICSQHTKGSDDALVLVARYFGDA